MRENRSLSEGCTNLDNPSGTIMTNAESSLLELSYKEEFSTSGKDLSGGWRSHSLAFRGLSPFGTTPEVCLLK